MESGIFGILLIGLILWGLCLSSGCSAYRATSKPFIGYSSFAPIIIIGATSTNQYELGTTPRSDHLQAQADIRAPVIICAEQLYLSLYGGSAASNSVLSQIEIPLVGAP